MLEKRYDVDRTIIVAIWGMEFNDGTQPGDYVIRSLATLAYYNAKAASRPPAAGHGALTDRA